jgi:hypothetical protein
LSGVNGIGARLNAISRPLSRGFLRPRLGPEKFHFSLNSQVEFHVRDAIPFLSYFVPERSDLRAGVSPLQLHGA